MRGRKKRVRKHVIADMSFYHLAYIISSCTFTIEPTRGDYGYDLSVFTFDDGGRYENGNLFIQLKATDRLKSDRHTGEIKFRIAQRDILTWESEPFPVYLVIFDAVNGKAYWLHLQRYFGQAGISTATITTDSVEVRLPKREVDMLAIQSWRNDKNAALNQMGAVTHV